jgi:hypothetical protein
LEGVGYAGEGSASREMQASGPVLSSLVSAIRSITAARP